MAGVYVILGPFDNYGRAAAVAQLARAKQREQITAVRSYVSYTYTWIYVKLSHFFEFECKNLLEFLKRTIRI